MRAFELADNFALAVYSATNTFPREEIFVQSIMKFLKAFWAGWKKVGQFIGDQIGRLFLMLFYVTVALPFGLG
ncbi:MAG: hypothetical protein HC783_16200, partial [Rhodobacteraceae bacterium]|nr:hypothetical protein [Paracoccaceae bacterium]